MKLDIKSMIIGFLLCVILTFGMALKMTEEAARFFSPRGLTALSLVIVDQLNLLRQNPTTVYPEITGAQVLTAIENKMNTIETFDCEKGIQR